ncbi:thiamine phosphate synthase [Corynebacterium sp. LK2510]|uniref:thiamine phosphate synthase n=1 Tax=Corynebacterium sp. LK2510 TaxID=3110472 RepID=UPI0034CEA5AA
MIDYTCYLITDPDLAGGRDKVIDIVEEAVAGGVTVVQLRDKHAPDEVVAAQARELMRRIDVPIVINDRVAVAAELGLHVHVGQGDQPVAEVRDLVGPHALIGLSCDSHADLNIIDPATRPNVVGIGPVWNTTTKADAPAGIGAPALDYLARAAHDMGVKAVAIGGIDATNVAEVGRTAVDGFCVVSAIMAADDPRAAARQLRTRFEEAR